VGRRAVWGAQVPAVPAWDPGAAAWEAERGDQDEEAAARVIPAQG
jgi:hypothetical protein